MEMLDFKAVEEKKMSLAELTAGLSVGDLHRLTDEGVDEILSILAETVDPDVVYQPVDSQAYDRWAADPAEEKMPWTLGHVVVHAAASCEEAAALAAGIARGVVVKERSRYETPWREVHTVQELRARLEESRRMRHAYLNAWPDAPHLDLRLTPWPGADEINAVGRFVLGLRHECGHLDQLRDIVKQARAARENR
jgi:hypothetical protein